jgi:hypothetical protein
MRNDDSNPKPKPRGKFMPWPFQAAVLALLAALGVAVLAD